MTPTEFSIIESTCRCWKIVKRAVFWRPRLARDEAAVRAVQGASAEKARTKAICSLSGSSPLAVPSMSISAARSASTVHFARVKYRSNCCSLTLTGKPSPATLKVLVAAFGPTNRVAPNRSGLQRASTMPPSIRDRYQPETGATTKLQIQRRPDCRPGSSRFPMNNRTVWRALMPVRAPTVSAIKRANGDRKTQRLLTVRL